MCSEMEAAALFVLCSVLRKRAGGIMVAVNAAHPGLENLCETAVLGLRKLIARDRESL